jgi:dTDP-glucose pyrophosphorylase
MSNIDKNIAPLIIRQDATIREALACINDTNHLLQLVVRENGSLIATVTDGDIRRALIEGADLDSSIDRCMHQQPICASSIEEGSLLLKEYSGHIHCVPVLDDQGCPTVLLTDTPVKAEVNQALILAGGFGTRLGERTRDTPKPLIKVAGRPIIDHLIMDLRDQGVSKFFIAAHYLSEKIEAYVETLPSDISAEVIVEESPLGTAGALGLFNERIDGPLLVCNGDIISRIDFVALANHHVKNNRHATIGAKLFEAEIPFGVLEHNDVGLVHEIIEKPRSNHFVSAGIYVLEPDVYRLVEPSVHNDMPTLLRLCISQGQQVGIFPLHEYWRDLGRPEDLRLAEEDKANWLAN